MKSSTDPSMLRFNGFPLSSFLILSSLYINSLICFQLPRIEYSAELTFIAVLDKYALLVFSYIAIDAYSSIFSVPIHCGLIVLMSEENFKSQMTFLMQRILLLRLRRITT